MEAILSSFFHFRFFSLEIMISHER
uniref:Uncharacterized protein n=1 Tax=Rhizophora mucronata TaxID=61149 RepID=A0A2P2NWT7_RHIMU